MSLKKFTYILAATAALNLSYSVQAMDTKSVSASTQKDIDDMNAPLPKVQPLKNPWAKDFKSHPAFVDWFLITTTDMIYADQEAEVFKMMQTYNLFKDNRVVLEKIAPLSKPAKKALTINISTVLSALKKDNELQQFMKDIGCWDGHKWILTEESQEAKIVLCYHLVNSLFRTAQPEAEIELAKSIGCKTSVDITNVGPGRIRIVPHYSSDDAFSLADLPSEKIDVFQQMTEQIEMITKKSLLEKAQKDLTEQLYGTGFFAYPYRKK